MLAMLTSPGRGAGAGEPLRNFFSYPDALPTLRLEAFTVTKVHRALAAPITRFLAIGVASTLAYVVLYVALAGPLGSGLANDVALALTTVANTAANRRVTFGIRGRERMVRHQLAAFAVFLVALAFTNGALALLHDIDPHPARLLEAAALVLANLLATLSRYVALSSWVFRVRPARAGQPS
jgi:putative flippase GtrA